MAGVVWGGYKESKEPCPWCGEPDALLVYESTGATAPGMGRSENPKHSDARYCVTYLRKRVEELEAKTNAS